MSTTSNSQSNSSIQTAHTVASANTFRTPPTNATARKKSLVGDPETLHFYSTNSLNYRPLTNPIQSRPSRVRERGPSYPSLSLNRSSSSSSRFRKTHYLDDSDEEIVQEEILEVTNFNRYPTLMERWGPDTKTKIRQEGDLKIEEVVEFEELEPTIAEEIVYELTYANEHLLSCRQISRSRSESRNFRKIRKKRIKRKLQDVDNSTSMITSNYGRTSGTSSPDVSGSRSSFDYEHSCTSEQSTTPRQTSSFASNLESTEFLSSSAWSPTRHNDTTPLNIHQIDQSATGLNQEENFISDIRTNESDASYSQTPAPYWSSATESNKIQYQTSDYEESDQATSNLFTEIRDFFNRINSMTIGSPSETSSDEDDVTLSETDTTTPPNSEKTDSTTSALHQSSLESESNEIIDEFVHKLVSNILHDQSISKLLTMGTDKVAEEKLEISPDRTTVDITSARKSTITMS
ncbi:unnamed protein product [Rotaria sp. Silwood2]|nr:unnamed protein product [Rotaria sp. Silwood2]